jgi:hypothetical protein
VTCGIEQDKLLPDSLYFLFAKVLILHRDGPLPVPLCCPDLLPQRALPMMRCGRVDAARLREARWAYRALKPAWRVGGAAANAERGDETSRALWWPVSAPPCSPPVDGPIIDEVSSIPTCEETYRWAAAIVV